VWVGHVILETDRLEETEQFMRKIGMRPMVQRPDFAVLQRFQLACSVLKALLPNIDGPLPLNTHHETAVELRGGTHLVLLAKPEVVAGEAPFDLMVEDLRATHQYFVGLGLAPTPIETVSPDHERFMVREPAGYIIAFFSNHVSGQPV